MGEARRVKISAASLESHCKQQFQVTLSSTGRPDAARDKPRGLTNQTGRSLWLPIEQFLTKHLSISAPMPSSSKDGRARSGSIASSEGRLREQGRPHSETSIEVSLPKKQKVPRSTTACLPVSVSIVAAVPQRSGGV